MHANSHAYIYCIAWRTRAQRLCTCIFFGHGVAHTLEMSDWHASRKMRHGALATNCASGQCTVNKLPSMCCQAQLAIAANLPEALQNLALSRYTVVMANSRPWLPRGQIC